MGGIGGLPCCAIRCGGKPAGGNTGGGMGIPGSNGGGGRDIPGGGGLAKKGCP